ncbi:MAG: hypothetical protein ACUVTA_00920 [Thermodesulfitimonas sp.]
MVVRFSEGAFLAALALVYSAFNRPYGLLSLALRYGSGSATGLVVAGGDCRLLFAAVIYRA